MRQTRQAIFGFSFVLLLVVQSSTVTELHAQDDRSFFRGGGIFGDIQDFRRDYITDKPFQYSPTDAWERGKVFRMHTGHWGKFYNCDGEENKRFSPYISWAVHDERDFPCRKGLLKCLRCDLSEVKQRILDGTAACRGNCGSDSCGTCSKRRASRACNDCGESSCDGCNTARNGIASRIKTRPLNLGVNRQANSAVCDSGCDLGNCTANTSACQSGNCDSQSCGCENGAVNRGRNIARLATSLPRPLARRVKPCASGQCGATGCSTCDNSCAPEKFGSRLGRRNCSDCGDVDTSADELAPGGLISGGYSLPVVAPVQVAPAHLPLSERVAPAENKVGHAPSHGVAKSTSLVARVSQSFHVEAKEVEVAGAQAGYKVPVCKCSKCQEERERIADAGDDRIRR